LGKKNMIFANRVERGKKRKGEKCRKRLKNECEGNCGLSRINGRLMCATRPSEGGKGCGKTRLEKDQGIGGRHVPAVAGCDVERSLKERGRHCGPGKRGKRAGVFYA